MFRPVRRYHRIDGWRGYPIPALAVAGCSDTGLWSDSPCPTTVAVAEIRRLQGECLRPAGIKSRSGFGRSSNVFCAKRWVRVSAGDFSRAAELVSAWLVANDRGLRLLHDADLDKCKVGRPDKR